MQDSSSESDHTLIEYTVDRVLDEPNTDTKIIVLSRRDDTSDNFPIWVGYAEGHAVKLGLDTTVTLRPMSHDLIKSFIEHLGVTVRRIVIGDVKNSTYYAKVQLENQGVERTVDARPSDAIALALRTHAPIYVTADVVAKRSTSNLDNWLAKQGSKGINTEEFRES